jgi:hypothetical protein
MDELAKKAALVDPAMGPGSDGAVRHGCRCSVLFNEGPEGSPFVDPLCPLHGTDFDLARLAGLPR